MRFSSLLFGFWVSLLGFAIAIGMFQHLLDRKFFSEKEMTKIGTAHLAIVFATVLLLPRTFQGFWIGVCAPLALTSSFALWTLNVRASKFRVHFRETLTVISLKMKSGRSFRHALAEVCNEGPAHFRSKLLEIANAVVFSQQDASQATMVQREIKNEFIEEAIAELTRIDQHPHAAMKRLAVYRQKLRMEDEFRRRSGQVLARIRAQSFVMTGLYIAVFTFMVYKFGWKPNARLMIASALLFVVGSAWIYIGGRRLRWKV